MAKNFMNSVKVDTYRSNLFDLVHDIKLSCNAGYLVPVQALEAIPGDKFHLDTEALVRLAPMLAPMYHRLDVIFDSFFVPRRLLWDNFEKWIGNVETAGVIPTHPKMAYDNGSAPAYTDLMDYMGIPTPYVGMQAEDINPMIFAAYQFIYNEYYRDQNLIAEIDYKLVDGYQTSAHLNDNILPMRRRAWEHDYFTSALPEAQKGDPVDLPLGNFQDVPVKGYDPIAPGPGFYNVMMSGGVNMSIGIQDSDNPSIPDNLMYADTSALLATATTINDLRTAFKVQEWLEKAMRGGSRYIETVLVQFGVKSSDKRLDRPEYIVGSKTPITISEVLNTSGTLTEPQGNMAGNGVAYATGNNRGYYCEEHGFIITIMSIRPKTAYQQGLHKKWLKFNSPFEEYFPVFANLGEQEIQNRELYAGSATGSDVFGYIPRYAEYRTEPNRVAGDFRDTLNYWHMGRIFSSQPALNKTFVECDPTTRVFANETPADHHYYCQVLNKTYVRRLMPKFGTPTF